MKSSNHWKIWLLLLPIIGSAEVFVHPTRSGIATGLHISMPKSEWTNCVAWYSAEFPTIGIGTTNYTVPDLSPSGNDATQPTISAQPSVVSNAFVFDGANDIVMTPVFPDSDTSIAVDLRIRSTSVRQGFFGVQDGAYRFYVINSASYTSLRPGFGTEWADCASVDTAEFFIAELRSSDRGFYVDNSLAYDFSATYSPSALNYPIGFGGLAVGGSVWNYGSIDVRTVKIYNN